MPLPSLHFKLHNILKPKSLTALILTLIVAFSYLFTVAPGYTWSHYGFDAGNLLVAIKYWGIPHPPGNPIYLLIGKLFTIVIPFGDMAYKTNIVSALFGLLTVLFIFLIADLITSHKTASFLAALSLAFSATFWGQSLITEVLTLNTFFFSLIFLLLLFWERRLKNSHSNHFLFFKATAFVFGLSLTNHTTNILTAPGFALFIFLSLRQNQLFKFYLKPKRVLTILGFFLLGLLPYLYLPLRAPAAPAFTIWTDLKTPNDFAHFITGAEFHQFFARPADYLQASIQTLILFEKNFFFVGVLIAFFGFILLYQKNLKYFLTTLIIFFTMLIYNLHYQIDNIETYYLPILLLISLWLAWGLKGLHDLTALLLDQFNQDLTTFPVFAFDKLFLTVRSITLMVLAGILLLIPASQFVEGLNTVSLHNDRIASTYAKDSFKAMDSLTSPNQEKILIPENEFNTFALAYYRYVIYPDRKDIIFLDSNGIYDSQQSFDLFKTRYPYLKFPEHPLGVSTKSNSQGLLKFIQANQANYPIFYAYPAPFPRWNEERQKFLEEGVTLNSIGPIYYVGGSL